MSVSLRGPSSACTLSGGGAGSTYECLSVQICELWLPCARPPPKPAYRPNVTVPEGSASQGIGRHGGCTIDVRGGRTYIFVRASSCSCCCYEIVHALLPSCRAFKPTPKTSYPRQNGTQETVPERTPSSRPCKTMATSFFLTPLLLPHPGRPP